MALTINTEVGDRRAIGMALANIGSIESEMSNFGAASKNLYEALEVFREIENLPLEAGTLHILGEMYFLKEDLDSAYSNVRQALEISRITKRRRTRVQGTVLLGRIKALQGDTEGAHELYRKAYDQILKYGFSSEIDEHFTDLRKLLQGNGIDPSALPWPPDWE